MFPICVLREVVIVFGRCVDDDSMFRALGLRINESIKMRRVYGCVCSSNLFVMDGYFLIPTMK